MPLIIFLSGYRWLGMLKSSVCRLGYETLMTVRVPPDGTIVELRRSLSSAARTVLDELERQDAAEESAQLPKEQRIRCVSPATAELLHLLILMARPETILEIGTSVGYSTIWLAGAAAQVGGTVVTVEREARKIDLARDHVDRAGLADKVRFVHNDALVGIRAEAGPFDFVFIDISSDLYVSIFDEVRNKTRLGCTCFADGWAKLDNWDTETSLIAYRRRLDEDDEFRSLMIPLEKGCMASVRTR